ncbi:MAG: hypothetical protein ACM3VX_05585 [Bacteroidota bacterium]
MDERGWYTYGSVVTEVSRSQAAQSPGMRGPDGQVERERSPLHRPGRRTVVRYRLSVRAVMVGAAVLLGLGYGHLWLQLQVTSRGYELDRLERQLAEEQRVNGWLGQQVEQAKSLSRVEEVARENLRMVDEPVLQFVAATGR